MNLHVTVCMFVCMCVCIDIDVREFTCHCVYVCLCLSMCVCMCVCTDVDEREFTCLIAAEYLIRASTPLTAPIESRLCKVAMFVCKAELLSGLTAVSIDKTSP